MLGARRTGGGTALTARSRAVAAKPRRKILDARAAAIAAARALDAMKAEDIVVLEVAEISPLAEYFVMATGTGPRHVTALAEEVVRVLKDLGARPDGVDGVAQGHWAVVDYGPVVVHCFERKAREFYDLDMLWGDGAKVRWKPAAKRESA